MMEGKRMQQPSQVFDFETARDAAISRRMLQAIAADMGAGMAATVAEAAEAAGLSVRQLLIRMAEDHNAALAANSEPQVTYTRQGWLFGGDAA